MSGYNRIILMGNLTRDPDFTYTADSTAIAKFGLAVNNKYKKKDDTQVDDTLFIDCTAFGPRAETISKYFAKGKPILVEGRLKLEQWTALDGGKRSKHSVTIDNFSFIDGPPERAESETEQDDDTF